jgi:hypothetical protein
MHRLLLQIGGRLILAMQRNALVNEIEVRIGAAVVRRGIVVLKFGSFLRDELPSRTEQEDHVEHTCLPRSGWLCELSPFVPRIDKPEFAAPQRKRLKKSFIINYLHQTTICYGALSEGTSIVCAEQPSP